VIAELRPQEQLRAPTRQFPQRLLQEARRRGWSEDQQRELAELWYAGHVEDPTELHQAEEEELL